LLAVGLYNNISACVLFKSALAVTLLLTAGLTRGVVNVVAVAVRRLSLSVDF
jgi:hypothetical protein